MRPGEDPPPEEMAAFFERRIGEYERHMLRGVEGRAEGYAQMARRLPRTVRGLLDLGCGTGLELDEIFRLRPEVRVTGVDLSEGMLRRLREKHPDRDMTLIRTTDGYRRFGIAGKSFG